MLDDKDTVWLVQQIVGTSELLGQEITPSAAAMLAEDLSSYPRPVLAAALSRVRTEHTGRLTPKAIIDRIDEAMGRPAANEAWAIAVTALDERNTVVWTDEMAQAWDVARPIANGRDLVGARMAFIAAYERLVRTARDERRIPAVTVSIGWDGEGRAAAVEKAVLLGYLPAEKAQEFLPALAAPGFSPVALLTSRVGPDAGGDPDTKERLAQLRADLAASAARRAKERDRQSAEATADWANRKEVTQRSVDQYVEKHGGSAK